MFWRIVRFPLVLILIEGTAIPAVASAYSMLTLVLFRSNGISREGPMHFAGALVLAVLLIGLWKALQYWLEDRPDRELSWPGAPAELGAGLFIGFALFSLMTAIVAVLGGFEVLGLRGWGAIWPMLAMAVTSGVFEEMLFRGVLFRHVESMLGTWAALGITSALFGAAHLANPDSSPFAALAIAAEAGILLGAAYLYTRRLWLAIGVHAAWNFTQGWVFSVPVSGGQAPLGLLITRRVGPDWLTGGDFGLEASVVAVAVATAAGVALLVAAKRKGVFIQPMWQRQTNE